MKQTKIKFVLSGVHQVWCEGHKLADNNKRSELQIRCYIPTETTICTYFRFKRKIVKTLIWPNKKVIGKKVSGKKVSEKKYHF